MCLKKTLALYMLEIYILEDPTTPIVCMLEEDTNSLLQQLNAVSDLLVL